MIRPALQDETFLADVFAARVEGVARRDLFHLWWLGQSGFLLHWAGQHLLLDPYLSDSLTKKYALTDKPHVRMTERVVDPGKLGFVDVVTSSHNHTDHLDAETLIPILKANPKVELVVPEANRLLVADRLNIAPELPIGLDAGRHVVVDGFNFHGVPAAHDVVERDEEGRCKFLGYVIEFGGGTIYHSGDTRWHPELPHILGQWNIDLALLPINGAAPERRVAGNLSGVEAARLAHKIGAQMVIPCHFEMFDFNTASPQAFVEECARLGQRYRVLRAGERWSSAELPPRS